MYLTTTRPEIMYVITPISRFIEPLKNSHWQVGKRIFRYIIGITSYGILYSSIENDALVGHTDSDFVGSLDDRKNISGYVFHLGSGIISWASKKQPIVTISLAKAKYLAAMTTICQVVWVCRVLDGLQQR